MLYLSPVGISWGVSDPSLPLKWGVPPPVSPLYMTFCQVKRGLNPINKVFVKNFWENFSKKSGLYIPPFNVVVSWKRDPLFK